MKRALTLLLTLAMFVSLFAVGGIQAFAAKDVEMQYMTADETEAGDNHAHAGRIPVLTDGLHAALPPAFGGSYSPMLLEIIRLAATSPSTLMVVKAMSSSR